MTVQDTHTPSLLAEDMFSVAGRVVVVTGGGTGIGKDTFVTNGAKVFIIGRREEVVKNAAAELSANGQASGKGGVAVAIQGDVGTKASVQKVFEAVSQVTDVVDVLVNCAGVVRNIRGANPTKVNDIYQVQKTLWEGHDDDDFNYTNAINVNGVYFMSVAFVPLLLKSEIRSIINVSSIGGVMLARALGSLSYGASKAANIHLTRLLAGRLSPAKIRVNVILPGIFPSEFTGKSTGDSGHTYDVAPGAHKAALRSVAKRPGQPHEIGAPCLMLGSKAGSFITGAVIPVDGGRLLTAGIDDGIMLPAEHYSVSEVPP